MSFVLKYPGNTLIEAVAARIDMVGAAPSVETASSILDDLQAAWDAGLDYNFTVRAVRLFVQAATYVAPPAAMVTDSSQPPAQDRCRLAERSLSLARNTWAPCIGLLDADDAIRAWQAIDGLYAAIISGHLHEDVITAGYGHIDKAPYPAPATAAVILRRLLTLGLMDTRVTSLVDYLQKTARFPQELALAVATLSRLDCQLLNASLGRSGTAVDALAELRRMDESVSDTFGSEFFVDIEGEDTQKVGDILTRQVFQAKSEWDMKDQFLSDYIEYIMGRVEAGTGNPEHAMRIFQQTFKAGFAPYDSAIYIAYLANSVGMAQAARTAIEELVAAHAVPSGFSEAFGTAAGAYRRAGGDPAALSRHFPMERLVEQCRKLRAEIDTSFRESFAAEHEPAVERFWRGRKETLLKGVGKELEPGDFDLVKVGRSRTLRLAANLPVKCCLDQLPGLSPIARQVFYEASQGGAPVSEVVNLLFELTGSFGLGFDEMARLVPAWAHSSAVAMERMDDAMKRHNEAALDSVINDYVELDNVPSGLLADLFDRVTDGDCCLMNREKMLAMGVRLWNASRGGSGARIARKLRLAALGILADDSARGLWIPALDAILDSIPDDDTRKTLSEWFTGLASQSAGQKADSLLLSAGMVLGQRIGRPFDDAVRASLRELVLSGDTRDAEKLPGGELANRIVRMNQWCEGDPEADLMIADWFHRWVRAQGIKAPANWESISDIAGLVVNRAGNDEARRTVAETSLRLMKTRLQQGGRHREKSMVVSRIESLAEVLPEAAEVAQEWRQHEHDRQVRLYAWSITGILAVVVGLVFIGLYSC